MRRILFTIHFWVAMIAGVFVAILGITGSIMAFEPELNHLFHPRVFYVTPRGQPMSLEQLGQRVLQSFPDEKITGFTLSTSPNFSAFVGLRRGGVFVDPYTAEILGPASSGGFLAAAHQLHLRLLIDNRSDPGKKIVSAAGVATFFLVLSGIYLWWPMKRARVQPGKRFWFDLHNTVGIFSFAFLLVLTVTGLLIGYDEWTTPLLYRATGSQPSPAPSIPPPPPGAKRITPDQAMAIAREVIPGAAPFAINIPGPRAAYQIRSRFPEDLTPGGRSRVVIDQYTGKVLLAEGSRTAPAGTRLVIWNRAIHTGDVFGIPSKVLVSLASLMAVMQFVSGAMMWWKRANR